MTEAAHGQAAYAVRFEWGPTGAAAIGNGADIAVVAAGERWPNGTLRPGLEDLWGAGGVLAGLDRAHASSEARHAALAYEAVRPRLEAELQACAGGVELISAGFRDDVLVAAEVDLSEAVPVLRDGRFEGWPERATRSPL